MLKIINKQNGEEVTYVITNQSMTLDEAIEAAGGEIIDTEGADIADVRFDCGSYYYDDLDIVYDEDSDLRRARKEAGLTQQEMSDILGIPKRTIGNWETDQSQPVSWTTPMILNALKRLAKVMHTHKYLSVDDAGVDIWTEFFETKKEANENAKDTWNHLTAEEQKHRHVYVTDVLGPDLGEDAFEDFVEDDIVDWNAYVQSGHDTSDCFDSENINEK